MTETAWQDEITVQANANEQLEREQLPTDRVYVNVYSVDRLYGGPEEGGWWYDHRTPHQCIPCIRKDAEEIRKRLEGKGEYAYQLNKLGQRVPLSSVLSRGEYQFYIEDEPPSEAGRPHYE